MQESFVPFSGSVNVNSTLPSYNPRLPRRKGRLLVPSYYGAGETPERLSISS